MEAKVLETNPFQACLIDSLHYACYARERPQEQKEYSRTSVLSSCLTIEALANCCLDALDLSGKLNKDFDKLPPLGKLDLYLISRNIPALDRGNTHVQVASRLIKLRNDFVHPRYRRRGFHGKDSDLVGLKIGKDDILKTREGTNDLIRTDAENIARRLNSFIVYFCSLANMRTDEALMLFSEKVVFDTGKIQHQGGWSHEALRAIEYLKLDMSWHPWYHY